MNAIILDTETHKLEGLPIEIAYAPVKLTNGDLSVYADQVFDEYFSVGEKISYGSMAVHHIIESDIVGKPSYKTFQLPPNVEYIIGHNIDYDIEAIEKCGLDTSNIKRICTLALARQVWFTLSGHSIGALTYSLLEGTDLARQRLRNAHNAKQDVILTSFILKSLIRDLQVNDLESLYLASQEARIPTIMPFGKYTGSKISDIPQDYKTWLLKKPNVDSYLRQALEKQYA